MPRPRRLQLPGLLRHVIARGNGRLPIFLDSEDFRRFTYLLGEVCYDSAVECWSYCLMPNHYHALLRPERPNISSAIQYLNGEYAKWWNRKHQKVGHTFQGRFKAQIIEHDDYLVTLLRYVARNPVRAGLVDSPGEWRWGSYRALAGIDPPPPFLWPSRVLSAFGEGDLDLLRARFVSHVVSQDPEGNPSEDRIRSNEQILGSRRFKALVGRWTAGDCPPGSMDSVPDALSGPDRGPTTDRTA